MSLKNELATITKSASNPKWYQHKWYQCELALGRAFAYIDINDAMFIMIAFMRTHLDKFVYYHPELSWASEWLDVLETLKPVDFSTYQFPFWDYPETPKPGTEAFLGGLQYSRGAYTWFHSAPYDVEKYQTMCTSTLSPAVTCTIPARLDVYRAEHHAEIREAYQHYKIPEKWTQVEIDKHKEMMRQYRQCTINENRDLWLEVVQLFKVIPKSSEDN
jgi:hypothetical protein